MKPLRLFISSVQKELAAERSAVRDYLRGDPMLRRFIEPFLFEDIPAADRRADEVYLAEVERCDIYLGLFGNEYGAENKRGWSPTQREFDLATRRGKYRLIFVKGLTDTDRQKKMRALIHQAGAQLIRRRFTTSAELITEVYAALVEYLIAKELIRTGPFDTIVDADATARDVAAGKVRDFVRAARRARGFPLAENTPVAEVLRHLHLTRRGRPTYAAILLFGRQPQRFLLSSAVKCAHFHGTTMSKPIPFYQVYKGTVFELVDQAVDFVLSKINLAVGTRAHSAQAPVAYEMPPEVVREAIVNAVAHRDYTSSGSVQVMLFSNRLEIWNPGTLPPSLTLKKIRRPHGSVPGNPLLAEPLYLTKYIERMGTGIGDMIRRCRETGLPEPEFALTDGFVTTIYRRPEYAYETVGGQVTGQVTGEATGQVTGEATGEVARVVMVLKGEMKRSEIQGVLGLRHEDYFREAYLVPAISAGYVEMTIPDKPRSGRQKYRLTARGMALLAARRKGREK